MLEALFNPRCVAVIGASRTPGKVGHEIVANLKRSGFAGKIAPVNPSGGELLGLPVYENLQALDETPELCVVVTPSASVKGAVEDSLKAGAKAIVAITAGFRETGAEGAAREAEIAALCKRAGARLLGPNCLGVINMENGLNASFARGLPPAGPVAVVSQSGALCTAILDWAIGRGIGLSKLVSVGNKADLSEIDFLEAFAKDDGIRVVVAYLESVASGKAFLHAAEAAAQKKPVIVFKAGATESGRRAAASHTGSLAGADIAYGEAFRRAGVLRASGFEELLDLTAAFALAPLPKGDRVAVVTNAGGPGIMAADALETEGLHAAPLGEGTASALRSKLPAAASVGNPIDVLGDAGPERYASAVAAAEEDPDIDALIVMLTPQAMTSPAETALAVSKTLKGKKPALAVFMGGRDVLPARQVLARAGLPEFEFPERAARALRAMRDYAVWRERPPRVVARFPANRRRVERILNRHARMGNPRIGEAEAKRILDAYGFRVPPGRLAVTAGEAAETASRLGFPVAMKIASPDIPHKTDVGGVRLRLGDPAAVRDAFDLTMLRVRERLPQARIEGVYVEKMCEPGREVILGMTRDPQFGPILMFGLGGIFVEALKDVSFHLAPITAGEALKMLEGARSFALLKGARGQAGADVEGVVASIQKISQLAGDFPQIQELDINPLIVGAPGSEAVAADARIVIDVGEGKG